MMERTNDSQTTQIEQFPRELKLSVRSLIEFLMRSGNLDNRSGRLSDQNAMQEGSRIHRKIQKSRGSGYMAEVSLRYVHEYSDFSLILEGRADGILEQNGQFCIEEIKGTYGSLEYLNEPVPVHRAQAMCYAFIYGLDHQLASLSLMLTYCNLDTEEMKCFSEDLSFSELEQWFLSLMEDYRKWGLFQLDWKERRTASLRSLTFPFPYRPGQRDLAVGVYRTILRRKQLFIQAPTGIGKTMSVLFPALKSLGEGLTERIFYLTAKTVTSSVARDALFLLEQKGACIKVLTITAKEKLCFLDESDCNPVSCPYADGHFDRINDALYDLLLTENRFPREQILAYAEKHSVCPFELCLDLSLFSDCIICDYNYVLDPNVCLKRFFSENRKRNYLFLIDEAHNLVERARNMYSASLEKEDFLLMQKLIKPHSVRLLKVLQSCNRYLLTEKRQCEHYKLIPDLLPFILLLLNAASETEQFLEQHELPEVRTQILDFYFRLRNFLNIYETLDDSYIVYEEMTPDHHFRVNLLCANPASSLKRYLSKGCSTIFFSATLLPIRYYRSLLSDNSEDYAIYVPSPFSTENRLLLVARDVSSRYTRRNEMEFCKIADYVKDTVSKKDGNYLVFFSSYQMLMAVYEQFQNELPHSIRCLLQRPNMSESEREAFLNEFQSVSAPLPEKTDETGMEKTKSLPSPHTLPHKEPTLVGFCIMGGIFGEGIDLTGDSLIGSIIVGTGLPQLERERELLKQYFENNGQNGFDFAYRYPGMNKVLQAAGRVIRTTCDKGVILLLDERFLSSEYTSLFPPEWSDYKNCRCAELNGLLSDFWDKFL